MPLDAAWFGRWQWALLWVLNAPLVGRWFRWVLCIRRHDVGYRGRIVRLLPHAYIVGQEDGTCTADFRAHAKYAKRLYDAFRWVWRTLHWWDTVIANRWCPALNLGWDSLTAYPDPGNVGTTTIDGVASAIGDASWTTLIDRAGDSSNAVDITDGPLFQASTTVNQWTTNQRAICLFDTSALGAGVAVTGAILSVYGQNVGGFVLGLTPDICVYTSSPASNTSLTAGDYSTFGSTELSNKFNTITFSTSDYNDFTLNSTGLAQVSKTAVTKLGFRNANYDVARVAPTWSSGDVGYLLYHSADATGTSQDPKLVVTYTPPGLYNPKFRRFN